MTVYLPITVDLCNPYPLTVMNIPQYNTGRGALITLTAAGAVVVPDKESLYIYVKKSDGTVAYANCTLQGTQIKADFDEQMTAVAGVMDAEIQMVDSSGNSITTTIFKINVMASNIDYQKITSQDEFLTLVSALAEVNELKKNGLKGDPGEAATLQIGTVTASAPGSDPVVTNSGTDQNAILNFVLPRGEQGQTGPPISTVDPSTATEEDTGKAADAYDTGAALKKVQSMISTDEYDQSKPYAVGDYCIYENALYKCVTAATGVWDATKWKRTEVGTELREQNVKSFTVGTYTLEPGQSFVDITESISSYENINSIIATPLDFGHVVKVSVGLHAGLWYLVFDNSTNVERTVSVRLSIIK